MSQADSHIVSAEDLLAALESGDTEILLRNRNRNLGTMFSAEVAPDYVRILYRMLRFRRDHELEVLNDVLFDALNAEQDISPERFNQAMKQLEDWQLVEKRLEKTRLRSYKDVRRDRFRYHLAEETISFLSYLEDRLRNDLLPRDDDSVNLLEFILGSLKQINRELKSAPGDGGNSIFVLFDVQEKTARLSQNLNHITAMLGDFLLRVYSAEDARQIVAELGVYFTAYLKTLETLRLKILAELDKLNSGERRTALQQEFDDYRSRQQKLPRIMRSALLLGQAGALVDKLFEYYRRNGQVDRLCAAVNDNAMRVLGKLTAFLKELERRSNRLEFINLRLKELASMPEEAEADAWLWELLRSPAAPLDPNDSDEYQKAEPPAPRSSASTRRVPPRAFRRVRPLAEEHVETHEEMRLRLLGEFIHRHYPHGGSLSAATPEAPGDFRQLAFLLKRGLLGRGETLASLGYRLEVNAARQMTVTGGPGSLDGPETTLKEIPRHG
jgi:hypothetical protein